MKSVLISIQPRWCELISAGKKTLGIRKTRPNMQPPFKCYIYCTKGRPFLNIRNGQCPRTNGTVIGEFICCYIDRIGYFGSFDGGKMLLISAYTTGISNGGESLTYLILA